MRKRHCRGINWLAHCKQTFFGKRLGFFVHKNKNVLSYLLDERHVFLVSGISAIFVLHLNCNNRAALGVLRINRPTDRQRTTDVLGLVACLGLSRDSI